MRGTRDMSCKYPKENRSCMCCVGCNRNAFCSDSSILKENFSNIIPSAQEAKQATKESIKSFSSQQLTEISQKIADAIADGDFSIEYKEHLDDKTYRKLKELGYKIDMISFVPKICSISWL